MMFRQDFIPYYGLFIDAHFKDFRYALHQCFTFQHSEEKLLADIGTLWTGVHGSNYKLPCLSVRSALDLYLQTQNFPIGSEVLMSAINIPHMAHIVKHHGLNIVSVDISLTDLSPKLSLLESLITHKTVAILVAHIFGKEVDMNPVINIGLKYKIVVIEDCAECFCGLKSRKDNRTDLALYSFGPIKFFTSFGGGIAVVKDKATYERMKALQESYPRQTVSIFFRKLLKYYIAKHMMINKSMSRYLIPVLNKFKIDYQTKVTEMLRVFPTNLMCNIRYKPCLPLLAMMKYVHSSKNEDELRKQQMKGKYVEDLLLPEIKTVGTDCEVNNYWLFPVVVEYPDKYMTAVSNLGIAAFRGVSQLNIVVGNTCKHVSNHPEEATYLIDHIVYLPVHKYVPYSILDELIKRVKIAYRIANPSIPLTHDYKHSLILTSKL